MIVSDILSLVPVDRWKKLDIMFAPMMTRTLRSMPEEIADENIRHFFHQE